MDVPGTTDERWLRRGERARLLAERHPATAGLLTFYAALAEWQRLIASGVPASPGSGFPHDLDVDGVLADIRETVPWVQRAAPPGLLEAVQPLPADDDRFWREQIERYLDREAEAQLSGAPLFVIEAVLQPRVENGVGSHFPRTMSPQNDSRPHSSRCLYCGSAPVAGILREAAEGARRDLVCGLCLTEWQYLRLVCPACGEQNFDALPVYTAEQFPAARIEACDRCHTYMKTIDATKDGHAVAVVDDIASVALDLWARDRGYSRLRRNLLQL